MTTCHAVQCGFEHYLSGSLDSDVRAWTLRHLDECVSCWVRWNRFRWQRAENHPLLAELRAYLVERGQHFTPERDSSRELAAEWRRHSAAGAQRRDFFASSTAYLYNLVVWEASGNRPDYTAHAAALLDPHETVMDLGCGIGSDTIALRDLGHRVQPVDYLSPSADFARWRFRQRGHVAEPDGPLPQGPYEAIWSIDTLDHIPDLQTQLGKLLAVARVVVSENPAIERAHGEHGYYIRRTVDELDRSFAVYGLHPAPVLAADSPVRTWMRRPLTKTLPQSAAGGRS